MQGYFPLDPKTYDEVDKSRDWIYVISIIRLFRLFRLFRLSTGLEILKHTMIASLKEVLMLFFMLVIPVVMFATFVYLCEFRVS